MGDVVHFGAIWDATEELAWGTLLALRLSAISIVLSLLIAVVGAFGRTSGPVWVRWLGREHLGADRHGRPSDPVCG